MNRADLGPLRESRAYPAVHCSPRCRGTDVATRKIRCGSGGTWPTRRGVASRVSSASGESAAVLQHLKAGIASIDLLSLSDGVAVFATPTETRVLTHPFAVPERVTVDDAFETRDLAWGLARSPRYRLLALAEKPTRRQALTRGPQR
jgi:hypothetical protein